MEGIRVSGTFADIYNQIDAKNGFEELQLQNERKFEIPEHQEFKEAYNWNKENRIFYYFTDNCMNEIENNCDSEEDVYNYLIQNGGEEKWGLSDDEYKDVCNSIAPRIMDLMYDLDSGYGSMSESFLGSASLLGDKVNQKLNKTTGFSARVRELAKIVYRDLFKGVNNNAVFDVMVKLHPNAEVAEVDGSSIEFKLTDTGFDQCYQPKATCYMSVIPMGSGPRFWADSVEDIAKEYILSSPKILSYIDKAYNELGHTSDSKQSFVRNIAYAVDKLKCNDLEKENEKLRKRSSKEEREKYKQDKHADLRKEYEESKLFPNERLMEGGYTTFRNHLGELDDFYDPYKKEPSEAPYEPDFGTSDFSWLSKDIDFNSKEGLEKAAQRWSSYYWSDFVHDIAHDGDKAGARMAEKELSDFLVNIKRAAVRLGLTSADTEGALQEIISQVEKSWKNAQAAEKRKATKAANKDKRKLQYADELRNADLPEDLKALFGEDGLYKERRSWGTIKDHFDKPYGKALKQLWVNQFGN